MAKKKTTGHIRVVQQVRTHGGGGGQWLKWAGTHGNAVPTAAIFKMQSSHCSESQGTHRNAPFIVLKANDTHNLLL